VVSSGSDCTEFDATRALEAARAIEAEAMERVRALRARASRLRDPELASTPKPLEVLAPPVTATLEPARAETLELEEPAVESIELDDLEDAPSIEPPAKAKPSPPPVPRARAVQPVAAPAISAPPASNRPRPRLPGLPPEDSSARAPAASPRSLAKVITGGGTSMRGTGEQTTITSPATTATNE
jgi:hypothetical protein